MPTNKKIWTSSYVLLSAGLAIAALALCIGVIEIRRRPLGMAGWVRFFEPIFLSYPVPKAVSPRFGLGAQANIRSTM